MTVFVRGKRKLRKNSEGRIDVPMPSTEPKALRRWILHICQITGITPTELAHEAGLAASTLCRFVYQRDGAQVSLGGTTISKLRQAATRLLQANSKSAYRPKLRRGDDQEGHQQQWTFSTIEIIGSVATDDWREAQEWPESERYLWPVPVDKSYAQMRVIGLEVTGVDMDVYYPIGSILICVGFDALGRSPRDHERVVMHRKRNDKWECAAKEFVVDGSGISWLSPRSHDPSFKAIRLGKEGALPKGITIPYLVIGSYRPELTAILPN